MGCPDFCGFICDSNDYLGPAIRPSQGAAKAAELPLGRHRAPGIRHTSLGSSDVRAGLRHMEKGAESCPSQKRAGHAPELAGFGNFRMVFPDESAICEICAIRGQLLPRVATA